MSEPRPHIMNDAGTVAYLPGRKMAVVFEKVKTPSTPQVYNISPIDITPWGDDNLFPQTVIAELKKTFVPSVLDWKARALYSGGIVFGKEDDNGNFIRSKRSENPEVWDFFKKSNVKRYAIEAAKDFYWFYNAFPELILSNDRSKIVSLVAQDASYCRWSKQNPKTGLVDYCKINANWELGTANDKQTITRPVIDPYYDPVGNLKARKDSFNYIYPLSYPSPGCSFYQLADWNTMRESGWLDISIAIPKWKKALMKNQISIKYHIQVPDFYWSWKYGKDWDTMSADKRKAARDNELSKFNSFLTGEENAGHSIMTTFRFNEQLNKEYPGWKIEAIDDKVQDGKYIEDSQEASAQMLYMLGVDGTLIGNAPGKGMGAGSGSDKRLAFNIYISLCTSHQDILLEPLAFIRDYNGWDPELEFRFANTLITTLDSGKQYEKVT